MFKYLLVLTTLAAVPDETPRDRIDAFLDTHVTEWRFHLGDIESAHLPDFDDSGWKKVSVGHRWWPSDSTCWFRARIEIPQTIKGFPTQGKTVRLICGMDNGAVAFVNGEERQRFEWWDGDVLLTKSAQPGDEFTIALQGINRPGYGSLLQAYLGTGESLSLHASLKDFTEKIDLIETHLTDDDTEWKEAIDSAYQTVDHTLNTTKIEQRDTIIASVSNAKETLLKITQTTPERIGQLKIDLEKLDGMIKQGRSKGLTMDYVRMKARVIRSFIEYANDDFAKDTFWMKVRAERIVAYLERLLREAIQETQTLLKHPERDQPVPRYRTGPLEIVNGAFQQNGRPVFFNGVGHFGQVREDIPILQEYGLNIIQIEIGPQNVLKEDGSFSLEALESGILKYLKDAETHHVAVCVLLSPHYFPQWAMKRHPELADGGHGFMKFDIDHPIAGRIDEKFLRAVVPKMASYHSLHSFCLSNEPQYISRSKISADLFHRWLKKRHGSIERLNQLYETQYERFEDIPQATPDFPDPAYTDWCEFNQERFRDWHRWMTDIIHEYAPQIPVHAKSMSHAWQGTEHFQLGVNHEDFARLGRITGNDSISTPTRNDEFPYAQHWLLQAMHYDFQRNAAPDNPIFNSENHLIPDDQAIYTPGEHIYTALWQGAIYGMGASTIWVWQRGESKTTFDNILTRPNCVEAAGRVSLDLMRLAPLAARFPNIEPQVGLFHAWHSNVRTNETRDASMIAYEGLANLGVRIKIVTEKSIREGALKNLPIVVAAKTAWIHPETTVAFAEYVKNGGTVFTIEPSFTRNEYGVPKPELSNWLEAGKRLGRVVRLDTPITGRAVRDLVGERLKQLKRESPVLLTDPYREALWGVLWMALDDGDRYLVNVVNMRKETQTVRLPVGSHTIVNDLISGERFPRELELAPLHPMLLDIPKKALETPPPYRLDF